MSEPTSAIVRSSDFSLKLSLGIAQALIVALLLGMVNLLLGQSTEITRLQVQMSNTTNTMIKLEAKLDRYIEREPRS